MANDLLCAAEKYGRLWKSQFGGEPGISAVLY